jgi:phospholipid transport system substrate-binding protein
MSVTSPRCHILLRLVFVSIAVAVLSSGVGVASEVTAPVEQLHSGLIAIMKAGKSTPFRQRFAIIAPVVSQTFDLNTILHQVIGPRWAALSGGQRADLENAFQHYTAASYVANFEDYAGQRFEVAPVVRPVGADRVVETRIVSVSGKVHTLNYVMRQEDGGWKVVDVLVEGSISRVAAQRSEMRSVLTDGGSAGLLVSLRQKTAELSGGILQ